MSATRIYDEARHYERMFPFPGPMLDFFTAEARASGGPVLELACGTGPLCIPLARAGFEVTGRAHDAAARPARPVGSV